MSGEPARSSIDAPRRRVVLLGASNLTNGIGNAIQTAERVWGKPLDVLAALGHGRSYGRTSRVLFRQLPGILECGLWSALSAEPAAATAALVTDIGNDILYEEPVERVAAWVEACLTRLRAAGSCIAMTELPVKNFSLLGHRRYEFFRRLFVPRCRLTLDEVKARALELNARLIEMAPRYEAALVAQQPTWYGLDPMHLSRLRRHHAWQAMMTPWKPENFRAKFTFSAFARGAYWRMFAPERRWLFGVERCALQPTHTLRNGTTISFY